MYIGGGGGGVEQVLFKAGTDCAAQVLADTEILDAYQSVASGWMVQ